MGWIEHPQRVGLAENWRVMQDDGGQRQQGGVAERSRDLA
jgi:hypothetical protein